MIEAQIYGSLKALCDGRVYPLVAKEQTEFPYIVYTTVSDAATDTFCGLAESKYTIQVDAYHQNYDELLLLKSDIINCLSQLPVFNINSVQSYEVETRLYRVMVEVSIII